MKTFTSAFRLMAFPMGFNIKISLDKFEFGMLFITRAATVAPSRLTSWVFRVASAGAIAEIYVRRPLSPGSLHLLPVTRAPGLFYGPLWRC